MNQIQPIDLHCHSTHSDGTLTPTALVALANQKGLAALALTDHDTVSGVTEACTAAQGLPLEVIPGVELAAAYPHPLTGEALEIHIVGLWIDPTEPDFAAAMTEFAQERAARNDAMLSVLQRLGLPITAADLSKAGGHGTITRAHYAQALQAKGLVASKKEAFQRYLGRGKPGYVSRKLPSFHRCIHLIQNTGGVAVLAHATLYGLSFPQIRTLAITLKEAGLSGIEVRYSTFSSEETSFLTTLAAELDLAPSGGSDYHGAIKPDIALGTGRGNLFVPSTFLPDLRARRS